MKHNIYIYNIVNPLNYVFNFWSILPPNIQWFSHVIISKAWPLVVKCLLKSSISTWKLPYFSWSFPYSTWKLPYFFWSFPFPAELFLLSVLQLGGKRGVIKHVMADILYLHLWLSILCCGRLWLAGICGLLASVAVHLVSSMAVHPLSHVADILAALYHLLVIGSDEYIDWWGLWSCRFDWCIDVQ